MENIPFDDYVAWPEINVSLLTHARKSWKQFAYVKQHGYQPKTNTRVGTALHSLVECLPVDNFDAMFAIMPDFKSYQHNVTGKGERSFARTTWVEQREAEFSSEHPDSEILSVAQYDRCRRMVLAIQQNTEAYEMVTNSMRELSLRGEIQGVQCKGRLDGSSIDAGCFWDLKTTRDISAVGFGRTAANLAYVFKMAFYWRLLAAHGMEAQSVKFIAVLDAVPLADGSYNEAPDCAVYDIPMIAIENQFPEIDRLLDEYRQCLEKDDWPGIGNGELFIPNWAMNDAELVG